MNALRLVKSGLIACAAVCSPAATAPRADRRGRRLRHPLDMPAGRHSRGNRRHHLVQPAGPHGRGGARRGGDNHQLRASCTEDATNVVSTASFDVVATRRDAGEARQVTLPYYNVIAKAAATSSPRRSAMSRSTSRPAGARPRPAGKRRAGSTESAAALPEDVRRELTRNRKAGDPDAAVDPLSDPKIRDAVEERLSSS